MAKLRNELPVAVHVASGGDARVRTGGQVVSFNGVSAASVQMDGATRIRGVFSARSSVGVILLVGYSGPLTSANASFFVTDLEEFSDDVPDGTTVYFRTVSSDDMSPVNGDTLDVVHLSFYG